MKAFWNPGKAFDFFGFSGDLYGTFEGPFAFP